MYVVDAPTNADPYRFEKSLYDLIRGLRNHKGTEREYIQNILKECRSEIRQSDMDVKATALLKLIYLEMFGHDMSWASFHVLEVMSSAKYPQKRVGYLGAEQTFRPDTDVLMLATNLLKKDLVSSSINTLSLPIATLPHLITSSLAMSVLSDLLPRLNHSSPAVRKKTIVTLYRLALVYPETLRPSWPKIKDRLMDESEDSSVTAAIVNVVCELGWRRPQDFLPMAPRLFELLVDSGNNWMAIKLIKLFATLTPLEPRLVRKLLPPLTNIIRTTPAMSLLYECIEGIIQGGILDSADGEEIATLCVSKLRGMIMVEGDANLKYVALIAFGKIVRTHPLLVGQQEDVILDCLDSADITIRMRALDLVVGMVSQDNLESIVGRLMHQKADDLPIDYQIDVTQKILEMCRRDGYGHLVDFDWYIDVLTQLVRNAPAADDLSEQIGNELRTVAVKVKAVRPAATRAAESILCREAGGALKPAAWIAGEFSSCLLSPDDVLSALLQLCKPHTSSESLAIFLQAIPKIFAAITSDDGGWTTARKTMTTLLMARILHTLEPLAMHPDLEVQERAVEFLELLRLTSEAAAGHDASNSDDVDPPLLLTQALPSLFRGLELNSIAPGAQRNVPPPGIDLDEPINIRLDELLQADFEVSIDHDEFEVYYHERDSGIGMAEPAINQLEEKEFVTSYQGESYLDSDILARRKERLERNRDDPFYIGTLHNIIQSSDDLDLDAIPVMQLDVGKPSLPPSRSPPPARPHIQIAADETLPSGGSTPGESEGERPKRKTLLQVDSSGLGAFSFEAPDDDAEMARAMQDVERMRLEMQRANERIHAAQGAEGTVVKKKKKKVKRKKPTASPAA